MTCLVRRPLIAMFAGLILPGLGQIYCGEVGRGAAFLLSLALLVPTSAWLALHGPRVLLSLAVVLGVLGSLIVYGYSVVAAYRSAARLGVKFTPGPWNRGYVYFALLVFGHLFVLRPLAGYAKSDLIETFKVPSASMLPAIMPGDRIFADKRVGHPGGEKIRRGAVAVFLYPNDRTTMFIKRIIGLPGDKIEIDGTSVRVNGAELRQREVHGLKEASLSRMLEQNVAFQESIDGASYIVLWHKDLERKPLALTVPNGQVFVLGDNRDASHDSRHFGVLPLADVSAVARQVWFSSDGSDGVRWRRSGKLLD
jgi:signal peptidase I